MIHNTHIPLDPTSEARLDAINTLRYTLFLDHQMPDIDDMLSDPDRNLKEIFTRIMEKTQSCCKGLFVDEDKNEAKDENETENEPKSKNTIYYNFFGTRNPDNKVYSPLDHLDSYPAIDNKNKSKKLPGLHTMILQHCIFSSYHAILTELMKDQRISSYKMENNIKGKGVHSLYKKGKISFDTRGIVFNERNEDPPKKNCSRASGFSEKIERRTNMIPRIMGFFTEKTGKTSYRCRPQFSQTCYHICDMKVQYFRFLEKDKRVKKKIGPLLDSIEKLTGELEPRIDPLDQIQERAFEKFDGDVVDALYHYYITERIFNLNLFYALIKNIQCIEMQTSYRLCQDSIIKVLTCCKSLPNVFSRQYFLKYAFDKIKDEPISYMNFWHYRDLERSGMIISSVREEIMYFDLSKWLDQYRLFVGYMSKFMIPVYEWCFINMLLGTIEKRYPDEGHIGHLERAFKMLSCYIEEEYKSILQPIKLEKGMDLVDVISEHSDTKFFKDLPENNLRQMINALIMANVDPEGIDDIELNLQLLNPAFFDDREGNPFDNNYKRVRNMYINLIRTMCMK